MRRKRERVDLVSTALLCAHALLQPSAGPRQAVPGAEPDRVPRRPLALISVLGVTGHSNPQRASATSPRTPRPQAQDPGGPLCAQQEGRVSSAGGGGRAGGAGQAAGVGSKEELALQAHRAGQPRPGGCKRAPSQWNGDLTAGLVGGLGHCQRVTAAPTLRPTCARPPRLCPCAAGGHLK